LTQSIQNQLIKLLLNANEEFGIKQNKPYEKNHQLKLDEVLSEKIKMQIEKTGNEPQLQNMGG
jgi:hypothetical protein